MMQCMVFVLLFLFSILVARRFFSKRLERTLHETLMMLIIAYRPCKWSKQIIYLVIYKNNIAVFMGLKILNSKVYRLPKIEAYLLSIKVHWIRYRHIIY